MRPYIGGPQQHHQQSQQYGANDNCLKQQQHQLFLKSQHQQQQQQQFQQNYHQHQQQQIHSHNHALQQPSATLPPPPPPSAHMWNHAHLNLNCYGLASQHSHTTTTIPINLPNCRPFPTTRPYQQHTHPTHTTIPHYAVTTSTSTNNSGFSVPHQNSERITVTTASPNYAKLPPLSIVNQQRINECAGIPLISTATAHLTPGQRQRISRKQSHSPPAKNWATMLSSNTASSFAQYAAAHVQGAPLMLQKPSQPQHLVTKQTYATKANGVQYHNKQLDRTRTPLRYQNSAPAALTSAKSKENLDVQLKQHSTKDSENSSSTNGDCNSNEACLPRIIKPRKRRKKDRKPVNNLVTAAYMKIDTKSLQGKSNSTQKSSQDLIESLQKLSHTKAGYQELMQHPNRTTEMEEINLPASVYAKPAELNSFNVSQCINSFTRDANNHGSICFCNECDPLRSLWDYPLRRSLSDSSATSESSGTGSLSENTTLTNEYNWPQSRAEIVGVIGSKRNKEAKNNTHPTSNAANITNENSLFNHNILSGINLSGELFKCNNSSNFLTSPSLDNMLLLPETAETLLTRSINEISKKLIETCSANESTDFPLSSCNSLSSFSTSSSSCTSSSSTCADFSNDSGIESAHINVGDDLVFNFDNLHIATTATVATTTTTNVTLSPSSSSSTAFETLTSSSSSSSSSCSSASTSSSSCGNISMSSSPTAKFATNFLTTPTTATTSMGITIGTAATNSSSSAVLARSAAMGLTQPPAPTLDFLVDLNNNHLHIAPTQTLTPAITTAQTMLNTEKNQITKQQKQQFNDLLLPQIHQPPQQQREQLTSTLQQLQKQHEQQIFNNCFDLMWQQHEHERKLANINTNTDSSNSSINTTATTANPYNHTPQEILQISSSVASISNNNAMSSFLDSVGSLKTIFSTIY